MTELQNYTNFISRRRRMDEAKKENEKAETQTSNSKDEASATAETVEASDNKKNLAADNAAIDHGTINDLAFLSDVRTDLPHIKPGDVLRVFYRVIEGGKERTQVFEGMVISIKNRGIAKNITVRKTSFGIAVERIFPLNSKLVQKIEVKKHSKVRRAKLYFLRNLKGKAARLKELR